MSDSLARKREESRYNTEITKDNSISAGTALRGPIGGTSLSHRPSLRLTQAELASEIPLPQPDAREEETGRSTAKLLTINDALATDLHRLVRMTANILEAHSVSLFLPPLMMESHEREDSLKSLQPFLFCSHTLSPKSIAPLGTPLVSGPLCWVWKTGKFLQVNPFEGDSTNICVYSEVVKLKSLAAVPIALPDNAKIAAQEAPPSTEQSTQVGERTRYGVLVADSLKSYKFSRLQLKLLTEIGVFVTRTIALHSFTRRSTRLTKSEYLKSAQLHPAQLHPAQLHPAQFGESSRLSSNAVLNGFPIHKSITSFRQECRPLLHSIPKRELCILQVKCDPDHLPHLTGSTYSGRDDSAKSDSLYDYLLESFNQLLAQAPVILESITLGARHNRDSQPKAKPVAYLDHSNNLNIVLSKGSLDTVEQRLLSTFHLISHRGNKLKLLLNDASIFPSSTPANMGVRTEKLHFSDWKESTDPVVRKLYSVFL